MAAPRGSEVWRDYVTDGIPSSGANKPKKSDIRSWSSWLESMVTSGVLSSGPWFATRASMTLGYAANTIAVVYNDPTAANNGLYIKSGASGSGSWTQLTSFLPGYQFVTASATGASTANAIVASTSPRLPAGDGVALVTLAIPATNTASPVTVRFDGGAVLTVKTRTGEDPDAGELQQNDVVAGFVSGATFRLISDLNSLRNFQSAKAWANNAEDVPVSTALGGDGVTTFSAKHWAAKSDESADRADDEADRSQAARAGAESARDQAAGYVNDIVSEKEVPITATRNGMESLQFPPGMNSVETRGYAVMGVGRATYVRVEAEPMHALKVRSLDRYLPSGSTDAINGGWWEISETTIRPEMAGAKGNGLVPDDVPLKNCLEYLRVKGGGKLRLMGYSYRLSAGNLPLYDHISIEGNLCFTEIKTDAGLVAQVFFNPERLTKPLVGVTISGLILNGQAVGTESFAVSAISIEGLDDVTIERCVIKNTSGYGFGAQASTANPTYNQPAKRLKLKDIRFENCGYNNTGDPSDAIDIKTVDGLEITNCTVQGAGDNGFNVRGQNLILRGNRAFDCANSGFTIANGQGLPCDVSLFDNKAFNCGVDGLQLVVANVAGAVALRASVVGFETQGNGGNGVRVYEAGGTTGNLYLTLSDISAHKNGFNGVNQAVPNAKSVVASNIRAEENVASGVGTSGSREVWTAISSNRNGLNGIREGAGANDNRFIGASCDDNVGNEIVLVGSRSMIFGQSGDAPTAIRTGYAENWVNNFFAEGRQTGGGPRLGVEGPDTNIPAVISGKGNISAQFFSDSFGSERARIDVPTSGNTALMVFVHDGAVQSLRRVSVGAADSGGSGRRMLTVPN